MPPSVTFHLTESEQRPAFIVKKWDPECANLVVFVDGSNDDAAASKIGAGGTNPNDCARWVTSAPRYTGSGLKAGTWEHDSDVSYALTEAAADASVPVPDVDPNAETGPDKV